MMFVHNEIDASIARDVCLVLSNDARTYFTLRGACIESIRDDDAATNDPAYVYGEAHAGRDGESWRVIVECAGLRVSDAVLDWIADEGGMVHALLLQVLDFTNRALWAEIALDFMPDPDDVFGEDD